MPPIRRFLLSVTAAMLSLGAVGGAEPLLLTPWPKSVDARSGSFKVTAGTPILVPARLERSESLALARLQDAFAAKAGFRPHAGDVASAAKGAISLAVRPQAASDARTADGYELRIAPEGVALVGNSDSGLFYGLQTLVQLVEQHGAELPVLNVRDEPDFRWRGYYQDISRGRVPKVETLEWTIDYLASQKVNMFQLYVEHPFAFSFNPGIAHGKDGLTADEVRRLDQYCRDRRIAFVPSLQSFGHMAGVLSVPEYCDLAEVTVTKTWEEMSWRERMRGATINPKDPRALHLLEQMHGEYLPLFSSPFVNVCADETYDLGEDKNAELAKSIGKGQMYLDHIVWLNELSKKHGKRMMFWGDIVKKHPELIPQIPKDTILLNWGYSPKSDFDSCKLFQDAGLDFFVCPGVNGWSRILAEIPYSDVNIRRYAEAGKKYGAIGLLNTDWGDHGHFNQLSGSLYGVSLGAAAAWNVDTPGIPDFQHTFAARTFTKGGDKVMKHWRATMSVSEGASTWELLYMPTDEKMKWGSVPPEKGAALRREAAGLLKALKSCQTREPWVKPELIHSARMLALLGERQDLLLEIAKPAGERHSGVSERFTKLADELQECAAEYEKLWLVRSREMGLEDIRAAFQRIDADLRARAAQAKP